MGILATALSKIAPNVTGHQVDAEAMAFLQSAKVPTDIAEDLCLATYMEQASLCYGGITIIASGRLRSLNLEPLYLPWFRCGYVTIAGGACGDPIAYDVVTGRVVYINHDEMDYQATDLIPSNCVIHTPLTYADFWTRATGDQRVPVDACQARTMWGEPDRGVGNGDE